MLIVTGSAVARDDCFEALLAESHAHVNRSRTEPGCISHAVLQDLEDPSRLFFFERWSDREALDKHFQQPGSTLFVKAIRSLVSESATLEIYETVEAE